LRWSQRFAAARPGAAIGRWLALQSRQDSAIVTQNIDNLHQFQVCCRSRVELHGNTTYAPLHRLRPIL